MRTIEKQYWEEYWESLGEMPSQSFDVIDYDKLDNWLGEDQANLLILNVGAGMDSNLSKWFIRRGAKVVALDLSIKPLRMNELLNRVQASGFCLPFKQESIDGIICENLCNTGPMYNKQRLARLWGEFWRVLRNEQCFIQANYGDTKENLQGFTRQDHEWVTKVSGFEMLTHLDDQNLIDSLEERGAYEGGAYLARKRSYNISR